EDAIGFEILGLAIEIAGPTDEVSVAALPLVVLGRLRGVGLSPARVELAVLISRLAVYGSCALWGWSFDFERNELRHDQQGCVGNRDRDLDVRQREDVARGDGGGRVRGERRAVQENRQDRREAADANAIRFARDLTDNGWEIRCRQPKIASR